MGARHDLPDHDAMAQVRYGNAEFHVIKPGGFVLCAVTSARIPLHDLTYWSAADQEPYADAAAALRRHEEQARSGQ